MVIAGLGSSLMQYVPLSVSGIPESQVALPRVAKDSALIADIDSAIAQIPTTQRLVMGDARNMDFLSDESVHLVVTSPPYWTLKEYRQSEGQLGHVGDYTDFLNQLDEVWAHCFRALALGGRLICVVGDVCLSRRRNGGRHTVVPLHSSIQQRLMNLGFDLLQQAGLSENEIHYARTGVVLPGFFRATKQWDLIAINEHKFLAAVELKSQAGPSYGNNFNNRTEEAIGSAQDIRTAFREGVFADSQRRWLGYLMLLEKDSKSTRPVAVEEQHLEAFPGFKDASYVIRYELLCRKLMREGLYTWTAFILTEWNGNYEEPAEDLSFAFFTASLEAHVRAFLTSRKT